MARHRLSSRGDDHRWRAGGRRADAARVVVVAFLSVAAVAACAAGAAHTEPPLQYPLRLVLPAGNEIWLCEAGRVLTGSVVIERDGATLRMNDESACPAPAAASAAQPPAALAPFVAWCEDSHDRVESGDQSPAAWLDQVRERMRSGAWDRVIAVEKGVEVGNGSVTVYVRMEDGIAKPCVILLDDGRFPGSAVAGRGEQGADALVRDVIDYLRREPDMPHLVVIRGCGIVEKACGTRAEMMISRLAEAKSRGAATPRGLVPEDILADMLRGGREGR